MFEEMKSQNSANEIGKRRDKVASSKRQVVGEVPSNATGIFRVRDRYGMIAHRISYNI